MQAVILAGGLGSRLSEETQNKPKPMVEIGGKPLLWHIMKIYSYYGINEFIICCGYKGYFIKEYFSKYMVYSSDIKVDLENRKIEYLDKNFDNWKITMIDTGEHSLTATRLRKIKKFIKEDVFCMTYGDGLSDVNIKELINRHELEGKLATVTAVKPPGRFGSLVMKGNSITDFTEKPGGDGSYVNGGFFVLNKKVFHYIPTDKDVYWEQDPLNNLARDNQLNAYKHDGFWRPMDTLRDKIVLEEYWKEGQPWIKG